MSQQRLYKDDRPPGTKQNSPRQGPVEDNVKGPTHRASPSRAHRREPINTLRKEPDPRASCNIAHGTPARAAAFEQGLLF